MRKRRKRLPDNPEQPATIHSLSHEGRGITHINGKTTFIHNALPEETVYFDYVFSSRSYDEGIATRIIEPSKDRVTPHCAHYEICGGCQLQHMHMDLQLAYKQKVLLEHLEHFGQVKPKQLLRPLSGEPYQYRHKARLGVRFVAKKTDSILVGFRERNGRFLTDMQQCEVLHPNIGRKISALRVLVGKLTGYEHIPQIEIAIGGEKTAIILRHMVPLTSNDLDILRAFHREHDMDIYAHPNPPQAIKKLFPDDNIERLSYQLPKHKLEMLFHPSDFTQINEKMNREMIDRALELLSPQPHETILDLFCGIGNFTLAIARYAEYVVGVEGSDKAVERAKKNAAHNNIHNTEFFTADLSKDCSSMEWYKRHYDKILLDPSRAGADNILHGLAEMGAKTIVYVSCNPATLSRDAGILVNQFGYILDSVGIINMFPHTSHMESIALFIKEKNSVQPG